MIALPIDIWLLVFDHIDELDLLWSILRNVSHYLRECIDEYFRYSVIPNTLIELNYSDIHRHGGPEFKYVRLPMLFSSFSEDGTRAVFSKAGLNESQSLGRYNTKGSVCGWVPFIERHCTETLKPKPPVLNESKIGRGPPVWEREHTQLRNTLAGVEKTSYLAALRHHTSIGRGDRPPYYLKIGDEVNDTELVDLVIHCAAHQISLDWRRTFSAFFMEQHFIVLAAKIPIKKASYDVDLELVAARRASRLFRPNLARQARRKRLKPWVARNRHRMTHDHRLEIEENVESEKASAERLLHKDNFRRLDSEVIDGDDEFVPERCADDHPDLLMWPWSGEDSYFTPKKQSGRGLQRCLVM